MGGGFTIGLVERGHSDCPNDLREGVAAARHLCEPADAFRPFVPPDRGTAQTTPGVRYVRVAQGIQGIDVADEVIECGLVERRGLRHAYSPAPLAIAQHHARAAQAGLVSTSQKVVLIIIEVLLVSAPLGDTTPYRSPAEEL